MLPLIITILASLTFLAASLYNSQKQVPVYQRRIDPYELRRHT